MVKITELKKLKRLYKVTFDDFFEFDELENTDEIYVCEDTIVRFMLSKDKSFELDELEELVRFDQFAQGKSLAVYFISFKSRTSGEVRKYLTEHEISSEQIEAVLSNLTEIGLLNDYSYAESFIRGKINLASSGPYQIKQKLYQKGIPDDVIAEQLDEFYDEEAQIDVAFKMAEKLVRQKSYKYTLSQLKQKIIQNLMAKGFSYSIADIVLADLELEADEENEAELLADELEKTARKYARSYDGYELKNRITQALARKGFDFSDIRNAIDDYEFD